MAQLAGNAAGAADEHPGALSIAQLYGKVEDALARAFPRGAPLWVRGEVQSLSDRTGHCYVDLVDPDGATDRGSPVLKVKCWRNTWGPMKAMLAREGIDLQAGMVVVLRGAVDFYRPRGEVGFIVAEIDVTALLGRLAAQRQALIAALRAEGIIGRNLALAVPDLPLRVGLVASPGTEGYRDFLAQILGSGFAFDVGLVPVPVQGPEAPGAIAAALDTVASAGCDLAVVVRGGGSRADLATFDSEPVARAIALSPVPVWTGIGHTGDESVADLVANRSFITPTECGRVLAGQVAEWWDRTVRAAGEMVARRAGEVVEAAGRRTADTRGRVAALAHHQIRFEAGRLAARAATVATGARRQAADAAEGLVRRSARLAPLALGQVGRAEDQLAAWRRLLVAYDVDRQLQRGYTLTLDDTGQVVRSATHLVRGARIVTRFADGTASSEVLEVLAGARSPTGGGPDASLGTAGPRKGARGLAAGGATFGSRDRPGQEGT